MRSAVLPLTATSRTAVLVACVLVALVAGQPARAQEPPFDRGIEEACDEDARTGGILTTGPSSEDFEDVDPEMTHGEAINCLDVYGIAQGRLVDVERVFAPGETVTREQMATFVARTIDIMPDEVFALPEPSDEAGFDDSQDISEAHIENVNQLTEAGIIEGFGDNTFRPGEAVDRAQMATFIASAIEELTGDELDRASVFDDVSGVHEANIEKLAAIGVTAGTAEGVFAPAEPVTRQQMGSFLARTLDYLAAEDLFEPTDIEPGTASRSLGLVDVDIETRDGSDRVTFALEGDDREAGWRAEYVDQAIEQSSGEMIEIEGEAIMQIILTGMSRLSPELPSDVADDVITEETFSFDGDGIVEVEVGTVFEGHGGQQQVFIGTTGRQPFTVERLSDPQRVVIDVTHAP